MSHVGTHRYVWLDGMRGLAALAVVLHHALSPFGLQKLWIPHAQLAVDFFFCMSGFVVAAAYQRRRESGLGFLDLMRRRWQRLYPMALCGIALGAVALLGRGEVNGQTLVSLGFNLMLQPDYSAWWRGSGPTWASNVAIWSVWIELLLSAAFAAWAWRASNRALLVALMLAAIGLVQVANVQGGIRGGHDAAFAWVGILRGPYPFLAGLLLWRCMPPSPSLVSPWTAVLLLSILLLAPTPGDFGTARHELLAALALVPIAVACAVRVPATAGAKQILVVSGALSYPLYALHYPIVAVGSALARRWQLEGPALAAWIGLEIVVALTLAAAAYRWLEPVIQGGSPAPRLRGSD